MFWKIQTNEETMYVEATEAEVLRRHNEYIKEKIKFGYPFLTIKFVYSPIKIVRWFPTRKTGD